MKRHYRHIAFIILVLGPVTILLCGPQSLAQEGRRFATKGCTELGGNVTFQSFAPVTDGKTGESITTFTLAPFLGYFVAEGFEIGLDPLEIATTSYLGHTNTQITIFLAPSYNFSTGGIAFPFLEGLLGYTSQSNGTHETGFSWGARGGVKLSVTDGGLLNLGIQYVQLTINSRDTPGRTGLDEFVFSAGFTVWL